MSGIIGGAGSKSGVIGQTELDYEEGTWTPLIAGAGGSGGSTSGGEGDYVKIGNLVYFSMYGYIGVVGSESGNLQVTGLPYTQTGFANAITVTIGSHAMDTTDMIGAVIPGGQSYMLFRTGVKLATFVQYSAAATGTGFHIAGCYHLA